MSLRCFSHICSSKPRPVTAARNTSRQRFLHYNNVSSARSICQPCEQAGGPQVRATGCFGGFFVGVAYEDLPQAVVARTEELFLDWFGPRSRGAPPAVQIIERFAAEMGPSGVLRAAHVAPRTSPFFAALVNGAAFTSWSRTICTTARCCTGYRRLPACSPLLSRRGHGPRDDRRGSRGYECGVRVGEFGALALPHLPYDRHGRQARGRSRHRAAAAWTPERMHTSGLCGTMAGLWEFLRDAADSKQLHTAQAARRAMAAIRRDGFTARARFRGQAGHAAGMSSDAEARWLTDGLGTRWGSPRRLSNFTHPAPYYRRRMHCCPCGSTAESRRHRSGYGPWHQGAWTCWAPLPTPNHTSVEVSWLRARADCASRSRRARDFTRMR